ncbi:hypothetical protein ILUMI_27039 [Ignelater luminosus]|uniref:Uncharacterized protein n=1 Tax=Ignelater luminosus TaxID=2038154 RepID=A0A8K0FX42_IGNLU|nr:hypothetical protein ILUMI_27039 [Ignelater luminosus]
MQILFIASAIILITLEFIICVDAWCNATNDQKHYMCVGQRYYGLGSLSVNQDTRQKIEKLTFLDCQQKDLSEEIFEFPSAKYLTVSCGVETIHENAFKNLNGLQDLDLTSNLISALPDSVFKWMGDLKKLDLSKNNLNELTRKMFEGTNNLRRLYLSYNSISRFNIKAFDSMRNLKELYLNNNKISVVPSRLFSRLSSLLTVDLSYNKIEDLGGIFTLTYDLKEVNLSHNAIEGLPSQLFKFSSLEVLDLSFNKLTVLYEDALKLDTLKELHLQNNQLSLLEAKLTSLVRIPLEFLDLRHNRLVFLEEDFIKLAIFLDVFKVEDNPWDCNCFEKMEELHGELSLDLSSPYVNGEEPLCVVGISNDNVCNINKDDLSRYYEVYVDQLGPR